MANIIIKTEEEIQLIRAASQITAKILDSVSELIKPGISTEDINKFVHRMTVEHGGIPAPLDYKGFPKSVCTSVNDVVCHGIPSPYVLLKEGDIINVDVTTIKDSYHGDSSRMYFVGGEDACSEESRELVELSKCALQAGMKEIAPGKRFGDIGAAIQRYIKSTGKEFGIVREYTGHGIGRSFHEPPQVVHVGKRGAGPEMKEGMIFTVEPMINAGTWKTVLSSVDGWTVRTADGSPSAQWEHTILVTKDGFERLTKSLAGFDY